jgi:hypothetical protein
LEDVLGKPLGMSTSGFVASAPALFHIFGLAVFTYFGIKPFPLVKATKSFDLAVGKVEATAVALIFRFCPLL